MKLADNVVTSGRGVEWFKRNLSTAAGKFGVSINITDIVEHNNVFQVTLPTIELTEQQKDEIVRSVVQQQVPIAKPEWFEFDDNKWCFGFTVEQQGLSFSDLIRRNYRDTVMVGLLSAGLQVDNYTLDEFINTDMAKIEYIVTFDKPPLQMKINRDQLDKWQDKSFRKKVKYRMISAMRLYVVTPAADP